MRERIPVVVQGRRTRRPPVARALWAGAELAVTLGAVLLLLVVHQLWWTNRQAQGDARDRVARLERQWATAPRQPATPTPGEGGSGQPDGASAAPDGARRDGPARAASRPQPDLAYAVLRIPRIGVTAPVAQGVGKAAVLNRGYVGHYPQTAQPGGTGNVALAGHRNTHGEPFRHLDRLWPGDTVRLDTAEARFTYVVRKTLPRTTPGDGTVLAEVPYSSAHPAYRFSAPGAYLTLTTCTPEYSSAYRLVVWAVLRSTQSNEEAARVP
ncbi:class E sortase [Streptomyces sp. NPDC017993]|uniref:class E sortase n=1 Tax=Streptomyces sp. NPDC017993 TaxID=3365027 RepID=UPI0037B887F5